VTASFDANLNVTVEAGFGSGPFTASPSWTDISGYVKAGSWTRGRSTMDQEFPAGVGSLLLDNSGGRFYPWNTSSPYSPNVTVGTPIRIRTVHATVTYNMFYGFIRSWSNIYPTDREELAEVPIIESYARLNDKIISASFTEQRTDLRVAAILDAAGWPAAARSLNTGAAFAAAIDYEGSALGLLRQTVELEQGELFQNGAGSIVFKNRTGFTGAAGAATFGPDDLTYTYISVPTDEDVFYNEARITPANEIVQTAANAASVTRQGPVTYESVNPSMAAEPDALNVAEWIVNKYSETNPEIRELVFDPPGEPASLYPEFGRELCDTIRVIAEYPGSAVTLDQVVAVDQIKHSFLAGGTWTTSYGLRTLSTYETNSYWVLGTSQLGTTTVLA